VQHLEARDRRWHYQPPAQARVGPVLRSLAAGAPHTLSAHSAQARVGPQANLTKLSGRATPAKAVSRCRPTQALSLTPTLDHFDLQSRDEPAVLLQSRLIVFPGELQRFGGELSQLHEIGELQGP